MRRESDFVEELNSRFEASDGIVDVFSLMERKRKSMKAKKCIIEITKKRKRNLHPSIQLLVQTNPQLPAAS